MQSKSFKLIPLVLGALALAGPALAADEPKSKEDEAAIEAKLEAARERLEAAAREVAELSGQLNEPMMREYMKTYRQPRAILGINLGDSAEQSKEGVALDSVSPGGPASDAGLKAGDVLTSVDGKSLRRAADGESGAAILVRHMRSVKPGDKVKLEYLRDGKAQKVEVVTEAMDPRRFARSMPSVAPIPPVPPLPGEPFTMAYRGFDGHHGLHRMELVTLTPKLGQYFGTDKGVLVVRAPKESELKVEEGDVILDIGGRAPQSGGHALRILRSYQPGEKVVVNILRNRKPMKLEYTMPEAEKVGDIFWFNDGEFFGSFGHDEKGNCKPKAERNKQSPARAPAASVGDRT